jgi:hypothetical protein
MIYFILCIILDAAIQSYLIERGVEIKHWLAVIPIIIIAICIGGPAYFPLYMAIRWLLFDIYLNIFRDRPMLYIGERSDEEEDAKTDNLLLLLPYAEYSQLIIKFALIIITYLCQDWVTSILTTILHYGSYLLGLL